MKGSNLRRFAIFSIHGCMVHSDLACPWPDTPQFDHPVIARGGKSTPTLHYGIYGSIMTLHTPSACPCSRRPNHDRSIIRTAYNFPIAYAQSPGNTKSFNNMSITSMQTIQPKPTANLQEEKNDAYCLSNSLDRSRVVRESPYAVPRVSRPHLNGGVPGPRDEPVPQTHQSADCILMSIQKSRAGEWARLFAGFAAGRLHSNTASSPVMNGGGLNYKEEYGVLLVVKITVLFSNNLNRSYLRAWCSNASRSKFVRSAPTMRGCPLMTSLRRQLSMMGNLTSRNKDKQTSWWLPTSAG